jgi:3-hydroxyisobutyrate dehydrogenase-like beta-hydroxyacid dehydrogenase
MKIGFIGLGIMGSRMAANLVKKGYELIVYNRTREKAQALLGPEATWAASPAELAPQVNVLFTMLPTPEAVSEVATGERGFLQHLPQRALWVDCSTVNPSFSRHMAKASQEKQVRFIDAPVAGSKAPAETGQLLFFVGGAQTDVQECRPLLETMGRGVIHAGQAGMGTSLKMVFNLLLGEAMAAFAEALALGLSMGLPRELLLSVLPNSAVAAPFLAGKKAKIETGRFEPEFPLKWMHKDLHLVSQTAYEQGVALPAGNLVKELFALAMREGLGDDDFSAICQFWADRKSPKS